MDVTQVIDRLRQEQQRLDDQLKSIKARKAEIDTTISVLQSFGVKEQAIGQGRRLAQPDQSAAPSSEETTQPPNATTRDGGPQALLRRLLQERSGQEFDIKAAYQLLLDDGWASSASSPINVVRSALSSMAERGELLKPRRGIYIYPAEQQEQSAETEGVDTSSYGVVPDQTAPGSYQSGSFTSHTAVGPVQDVDMFAAAEEPEEDRRGHDPFAPASRKLGRTVLGPTQPA